MAWHITHKGCPDSHRARRSCPLRPDRRAGVFGPFTHAFRGVVMGPYCTLRTVAESTSPVDGSIGLRSACMVSIVSG